MTNFGPLANVCSTALGTSILSKTLTHSSNGGESGCFTSDCFLGWFRGNRSNFFLSSAFFVLLASILYYRLVTYCDLRIKPNITRVERDGIMDLCSREYTIITKSDKGGELVVMEESHLKRLCMEHLSDTSTYQNLKTNPTNYTRLKVDKTLDTIFAKRGFSNSLRSRLKTPPSAKTQRFYALPKTHKKNLKIRPIVSACGGIFDRLGWLLQQILKPLLKNVAAHLRSTADLISRCNSIDQDQLQGKIFVSFDVVSLYTNVDTTEAIDTTLE